jgi:hypothetical protein
MSIINVNVNLAEAVRAMTVWTISAQRGTGGTRLATELATAADIPLLDREALALFAQRIDPDFPEVDELEGASAAGSTRLLSARRSPPARRTLSARWGFDRSFPTSDGPSLPRRLSRRL